MPTPATSTRADWTFTFKPAGLTLRRRSVSAAASAIDSPTGYACGRAGDAERRDLAVLEAMKPSDIATLTARARQQQLAVRSLAVHCSDAFAVHTRPTACQNLVPSAVDVAPDGRVHAPPRAANRRSLVPAREGEEWRASTSDALPAPLSRIPPPSLPSAHSFGHATSPGTASARRARTTSATAFVTNRLRHPSTGTTGRARRRRAPRQPDTQHRYVHLDRPGPAVLPARDHRGPDAPSCSAAGDA